MTPRPSGWDQLPLGDVVTLKRGYDLPSKARRQGTVPIVSSAGVTGFHDEPKVAPPGVVTGRYGTLGQVFYIEEPFWPLNTTLFVQDFKGNDPRWVSYLLRVQGFGEKSGAAAVPGVDRNVLHRLPVLRPPLRAQLKIAAILSAYDILIENNTRRIRILEEMAQAIYREWFVEFRFPGHESVGMVESQIGRIPRGWSVRTIAELAGSHRNSVTSGPFGSKLGRRDYVEVGVPVIRGTNLAVGGAFRDSDFAFVTEEKADELGSSIAEAGDIVVTQRGTLGQVGLIPLSPKHGRYVLSQSQMRVRVDAGEADTRYVYAALRSQEATERIKNMGISAGVPHINLDMFRQFPLVCPHLALQKRFAEVVEPIELFAQMLLQETEVLSATHALLLPRLISGQLDVATADIRTSDLCA